MLAYNNKHKQNILNNRLKYKTEFLEDKHNEKNNISTYTGKLI